MAFKEAINQAENRGRIQLTVLSTSGELGHSRDSLLTLDTGPDLEIVETRVLTGKEGHTNSRKAMISRVSPKEMLGSYLPQSKIVIEDIEDGGYLLEGGGGRQRRRKGGKGEL